MGRRGGFSLVEVLATIAVGSVLFGLAIAVLSMLLRVGSGSREQSRQHTAITRLADQFRRDVHAAQRVAALPAAAGGAQPGWQFHLGPGHVVEYRPQGLELLRSERSGDEIQRQEGFRLPPETTVSLRPSEAVSGIVSLRLVSESNPVDPPRFGVLEIEAALAQDGRFEKGPAP